jgi:hypothetical protein
MRIGRPKPPLALTERSATACNRWLIGRGAGLCWRGGRVRCWLARKESITES